MSEQPYQIVQSVLGRWVVLIDGEPDAGEFEARAEAEVWLKQHKKEKEARSVEARAEREKALDGKQRGRT